MRKLKVEKTYFPFSCIFLTSYASLFMLIQSQHSKTHSHSHASWIIFGYLHYIHPKTPSHASWIIFWINESHAFVFY